MMEKIGICSLYSGSNNYGGLLQAYALTNKLSDFGFEAMQLQVFPKISKKKNYIILSWELLVKYGLFFYLEIVYSFIMKKVKHTEKKEYLIDLSKKQCSLFRDSINHTEKKEYGSKMHKFDYIIVGSDQIWAPQCWHELFFLEFDSCKQKHISYAASIGRYDFTRYSKKVFKEGLQNFKSISVREDEAKEFLEANFDVKAERVLDPTFLIEAKEWEKIEESKQIKGSYIFCYIFHMDKNKRKIIQEVARKLNCQIIYPAFESDNYWKVDGNKEILLGGVGPKEWLWLIHHAELVITDSFHGNVFSIIYEKPFLHLLRHSGKKKGNMNSRISTLLNMFDLTEYCVSSLEQAMEMLDKKIDYDKVNKILEEEREKSMNFLLSNLK